MTNAKLQMNSKSMTSSISLTSAKAMTALLGGALLGGALLGGCSSSAQWPSSPMAVSEVVALDGSKGQLSEGVAVRGKTAYLGYVGSGEVVAVDLDSGELSPYGQLPAPVPNMGFVSGLAVHGDELFGALVSFSPEVQAGVYRVRAGAAAQLYASAPGMVFPNGIAFDDDDRMYITDSAAGAVFRVSADGQVTKWLADPLLTGGKDFCGVGKGVGVPFDIGANGIAIDGDTVFITNTDRGQVVRVAIEADGSAGAPSLLAASSCEQLSGADGLTLAPDGELIIAVNHQHKLVRVDRDGAVSPLVTGAPLDFPASVTFEGGALYLSNFAFLDAKTPGLLRIR